MDFVDRGGGGGEKLLSMIARVSKLLMEVENSKRDIGVGRFGGVFFQRVVMMMDEEGGKADGGKWRGRRGGCV